MARRLANQLNECPVLSALMMWIIFPKAFRDKLLNRQIPHGSLNCIIWNIMIILLILYWFLSSFFLQCCARGYEKDIRTSFYRTILYPTTYSMTSGSPPPPRLWAFATGHDTKATNLVCIWKRVSDLESTACIKNAMMCTLVNHDSSATCIVSAQ